MHVCKNRLSEMEATGRIELPGSGFASHGIAILLYRQKIGGYEGSRTPNLGFKRTQLYH